MTIKNYLKDKWLLFILFLLISSFVLSMCFAFKVPTSFTIALFTILSFFFILSLLIDYLRKKSFYSSLLNNIERLDKSYLVLETIKKPFFYEGELIYQALYDINKSMTENVKNLENQTQDFKEYIEMWIHEIKIPLSSLILIAHNHPDKFDKKSMLQIKRIEDYIEQVLYYVRSENAEKDYLIKENSLDKIITQVALKNKDDLLERKIDLIVPPLQKKVLTDAKWLEFILNQIVNNSIKYKRDIENSYIKFSITENSSYLILTIEDNGIGIPQSDLPKVFDKTFTGYNGRIKSKSTGMGLNIIKNLCSKLGHKIEIESHINQYTKVHITFYKNNYYEVLK